MTDRVQHLLEDHAAVINLDVSGEPVACTGCHLQTVFHEEDGPSRLEQFAAHVADLIRALEPARESEACACDPSDGPQEDCPQHGRPYSWWVAASDRADQRLLTLLSSEEVELVEKLGSLMADFAKILDAGRQASIDRRVAFRGGERPTAEDLRALGDNVHNDGFEVMLHVHALQDKVLAQAAARAYEGQYRLMGGSLR